MKRYEADRIDLSPLTFRLDVEYKSGKKDTLLLIKTVQEESIALFLEVDAGIFRENGTVFIAVRGNDADGVLNWTTAKAPVFVEGAIDTDGAWSGELSEPKADGGFCFQGAGKRSGKRKSRGKAADRHSGSHTGGSRRRQRLPETPRATKATPSPMRTSQRHSWRRSRGKKGTHLPTATLPRSS